VARRRSLENAREPKSLRRTVLEILLGGGLFAAAIPLAERFFEDNTRCAVAYESVNAIKGVEEVPPELRTPYVRHVERQLKIAEKCDREAEQ
jgi:hypothetical protein